MKRQQFYLPQSLGHLRDRWKGLAEEYIDKLEAHPSDAQKNVV